MGIDAGAEPRLGLSSRSGRGAIPDSSTVKQRVARDFQWWAIRAVGDKKSAAGPLRPGGQQLAVELHGIAGRQPCQTRPPVRKLRPSPRMAGLCGGGHCTGKPLVNLGKLRGGLVPARTVELTRRRCGTAPASHHADPTPRAQPSATRPNQLEVVQGVETQRQQQNPRPGGALLTFALPKRHPGPNMVRPAHLRGRHRPPPATGHFPRKRESKGSWPMLTYRPQEWMDSRLRGNDGLVGPKTLRRDSPGPAATLLKHPSGGGRMGHPLRIHSCSDL